jgi:hypothetical protein
VSIARLNPILAVLTTSSNAGTYSDHPAYPGFGRRLSEPSTPNGGDLYIPNGAKSVGSTWYALKNGANSDLTARLGGVGGGNENPSSQGGWHQGAYSPYGWVGKTSNADEQACDFPADTSPIGFDDSATCYPPWGLMCADGNNVDVVKLRFLIMWKFNGKYVYDVEVQGDGRATNQWPEPDLQVEVLQPTNVGTADAPIADVRRRDEAHLRHRCDALRHDPQLRDDRVPRPWGRFGLGRPECGRLLHGGIAGHQFRRLDNLSGMMRTEA